MDTTMASDSWPASCELQNMQARSLSLEESYSWLHRFSEVTATRVWSYWRLLWHWTSVLINGGTILNSYSIIQGVGPQFCAECTKYDILFWCNNSSFWVDQSLLQHRANCQSPFIQVEQCVTSIPEDHEATCWGCGLRLVFASYSPVYRCGWCGAITQSNQTARKPDSVCFSHWRRLRDRFFVTVLILFMLFVICRFPFSCYQNML